MLPVEAVTVDVVRLLLSARADPNGACGDDRTTALIQACKEDSEITLPMVELLLQHKADPNQVRGSLDWA